MHTYIHTSMVWIKIEGLWPLDRFWPISPLAQVVVALWQICDSVVDS
eukprot:SAG25_NODE_13984_length_260_cov_0.956522_1_plen_46_part_10